jgi:hypothetical protein
MAATSSTGAMQRASVEASTLATVQQFKRGYYSPRRERHDGTHD